MTCTLLKGEFLPNQHLNEHLSPDTNMQHSPTFLQTSIKEAASFSVLNLNLECLKNKIV